MTNKNSHILNQFHPAIRQWFEQAFGEPTPPQNLGWPAIFRDENTLILAPTGSGKTLAAFLVCIDRLLERGNENVHSRGVHTVYISPLKALNYDIERNLEAPLTGIREQAKAMGLSLPQITKAVRTGDTPQKERQQMLRQQPDILITTPESLHLLLTSVRAREILRTVKYVIVDEIHSLSENKRGTFLSLLLERLQYLTEQPFVRIGLSATQRPLEKIAKYLGGNTFLSESESAVPTPRPVTIIDAGMRKEMELQVVSPVRDFRELPDDSVWPDIYQKLLELVKGQRSTLIFTNSRASAERITAELNDLAGFELARAHHGSVSKEKRKDIEEKLKQGELPVLVATATLELGIDMGAIDLVCQVESPKSVARGLQRVGRAGHLFKSVSKGRLLPKMRSDLLEMAVIARLMHQGDVAPIHIPRNCLDILAQQIVAIVSLKPWKLDELYQLIRGAYPYQDLPYDHFLGVAEMLSGRYPSDAFRDLKPRISWDRVNSFLYPMPGSQRLAILSGGAIPDTGQYPCYLEDGHTKIGELEEEFIYERRLGEVFVLGTNSWRIEQITHDRVIVSPAPGEPARTPFWKGEFMSRSVHLGQKYGEYCRQLKTKIDQPDCVQWLMKQSDLDQHAADNLQQYFLDQQKSCGDIPDDKTIMIEGFTDEIGDLRVLIHSPYGGRLHLPWRLALLAQFRRMWKIEPESWHSDIGILFRFPAEKFDQIVHTIRSVNSENFEELVVDELGNSFFFGIRFRHNANRAMLIPRPRPGKRAPLWLQRIRSRDLLEIARQYPSFPIVMETYRESMQDFFAMEELKALLQRIESNEITVKYHRGAIPSPFASSLMFEFMAGYMYEYDETKAGQREDLLDRDLLEQLLNPGAVPKLLDEAAIRDVEQRLQAKMEGYQARTATELAELLLRIGDLTEDEISARIDGDAGQMLTELTDSRRALKMNIPKAEKPERWISAEDAALYKIAFAGNDSPQENVYEAQQHILRRYLRYRTFTTAEEIRERYPLHIDLINQHLKEIAAEHDFVRLPGADDETAQRWIFRETLERIRKVTIFRRRNQVQPCDTSRFVEFLLKWQHRTPNTKLSGHDGLITVLEQLQGLPLPAQIWENDIFATRLDDYRKTFLDDLCTSGEIVWNGTPGSGTDWGNLAFSFREDHNRFLALFNQKIETIPDDETLQKVQNALREQGAIFIHNLSLETGLPPSSITAALWRLVWYGTVTNDTFAVIRAGKPAVTTDPHTGQFYSRRGRRGQRLTRRYRPLEAAGRWTALSQNSEVKSEQIEILTRQMLHRYGLLCREIYELEGWAVPWRTIYDHLIRLEWRGEIQRGYFVHGLSGLQFALPAAADELLSIQHQRSSSSNPANEFILINSCDPANLYGAASPLQLIHPLISEWRFLRHPNNYLILKNSIPVIAIEARATRLTPLHALSNDDLFSALYLLPRLLDDPAGWRRFRILKIEQWNHRPVRNSEIADILKDIGFRDEYKQMILERKILK